MFSNDKQFRRPDGTLYDPSNFNMKQYEKQYGPGGVPEGYSMGAITPVQSPATIIGLGVFLVLISVMMLTMGILSIGQGAELRTIIMMFVGGAGGLTFSVYSFRLAGKRKKWLQEQGDKAAQHLNS